MSDLVQKLIAENKASKATFLDLGKCGLTEIPAEVGDLVWLEGLLLARHQLEWEDHAWTEQGSVNDGAENSFADLGHWLVYPA